MARLTANQSGIAAGLLPTRGGGDRGTYSPIACRQSLKLFCQSKLAPKLQSCRSEHGDVVPVSDGANSPDVAGGGRSLCAGSMMQAAAAAAEAHVQSDSASRPKVSVVIPTYNRGNCIGEAVQSILAQTYQASEIIVVDDGSTDDTEAALAWCRNQIRYVYQRNAGVAAARNTGMRLARSQWIAFLDSDDQWFVDKLAVQMQQLAAQPQAVCHVCNLLIERSAATADIDLFSLCQNRQLTAEAVVVTQPLLTVLHGNCFVQAAVVRRDVLATVGGFRHELSLYEDLEWFTRLAQAGPWIIGNRALLRLRRRHGMTAGLSLAAQTRPLHSRIRYIRILRQLLQTQCLNRHERQFIGSRLSCYFYDLAEISFHKRRQRRAWLLLRASLVYGNGKSWLRVLPALLSAGHITRWRRLQRSAPQLQRA